MTHWEHDLSWTMDVLTGGRRWPPWGLGTTRRRHRQAQWNDDFCCQASFPSVGSLDY